MPAPLSEDLRSRVIQAYNNKEGSQREIASRFNVSLSFVRNLLKRFRKTGSIKPKKNSGGCQSKINKKLWAIIKVKVRSKPDIYLSELCEELEKKTGIKVSCSTMHRTLKQMKITRKKKVYMLVNKKEKMSKKNVIITVIG